MSGAIKNHFNNVFIIFYNQSNEQDSHCICVRIQWENYGRLVDTGDYDPVVTDCIEAGKVEAAKLSPGAVIVTAMRLSDGTAKEFINWLKTEN